MLVPALCPAQDQVPLGVDNQRVIGEPLGSPVAGKELDERTEELTDVMRCPVCQGLSIADSGYQVYLVERKPSIGGHMAQLDKTFPTLDCSI